MLGFATADADDDWSSQWSGAISACANAVSDARHEEIRIFIPWFKPLSILHSFAAKLFGLKFSSKRKVRSASHLSQWGNCFRGEDTVLARTISSEV